MNPLAERIVDLFMPVEKESKCNFAEFCFMLAHFQPTNEETPDEMPNSGPVKLFENNSHHSSFGKGGTIRARFRENQRKAFPEVALGDVTENWHTFRFLLTFLMKKA